jgi:hypothetical protein
MQSKLLSVGCIQKNTINKNGNRKNQNKQHKNSNITHDFIFLV